MYEFFAIIIKYSFFFLKPYLDIKAFGRWTKNIKVGKTFIFFPDPEPDRIRKFVVDSIFNTY